MCIPMALLHHDHDHEPSIQASYLVVHSSQPRGWIEVVNMTVPSPVMSASIINQPAGPVITESATKLTTRLRCICICAQAACAAIPLVVGIIQCWPRPLPSKV